jgi:UDP:flavonoid glycosyltransferase YjiC (YdhE family)
VEWARVGVNLRTETPTASQIRRATHEVLSNPAYRQRAQAIQADYARHDGPAEAARLLEQLAATGQPVLRAEPAWPTLVPGRTRRFAVQA